MTENPVGVPVAQKSSQVKVRCILQIVSISVLALLLVALGVLMIMMAGLLAVGIPAILLGVLCLGLTGIYIPQLVILGKSPEVLIAQNGDTLNCYCGKDGMRAFSIYQIAQITPSSGFFTSFHWIQMASGHYDGGLKLTLTTGETFKVPFVREVQAVAATVQRICTYIVAPQPVRPVQPVQPVEPQEQPVEPQEQPVEPQEQPHEGDDSFRA